MHPSSTRNKTVTLNGVTINGNFIADDAQANGKGVRIVNNTATYSLTVNITSSCIADNTSNGTYHQVDIAATGDGGAVFNADTLYVEGGIAAEVIATGGNDTITNTDELIGTLNLSASYAPQHGCVLLGSGKKWGADLWPPSANGEPFSSWDMDAGGNQSKNVPFHPKNL